GDGPANGSKECGTDRRWARRRGCGALPAYQHPRVPLERGFPPPRIGFFGRRFGFFGLGTWPDFCAPGHFAAYHYATTPAAAVCATGGRFLAVSFRFKTKRTERIAPSLAHTKFAMSETQPSGI